MTISLALLCAASAPACDRDEKPEGAQEEGAAKVGEGTEATTPTAGAAGGATCATAAANIVKIMKPELEQQLAQLPEEQKAQAQQQMQAQFNAEVIAANCEQQRPGQEELNCIAKASSTLDLQACQGPPPGHGGAPVPGAAPGATPPPAEGTPDPAAEGDEAAGEAPDPGE